MKMRELLFVAAVMLLAGCEEHVSEIPFGAMPEGLEGCRIFRIQTKSGNDLTVVRCPNSAVASTYKSGKVTKKTVVVEGVEYEQK